MTSDDMFGDSVYESGDPVDDVEFSDPADTLNGDDPDEDQQTGYSPPEREPYNLRHPQTLFEERRGESLDEHLAEEEPDVSPGDVDLANAEPRTGRLVAPDEGAHADVESDEIATDVGPAGYTSSAEEAAVHVIEDEDEDDSFNVE